MLLGWPAIGVSLVAFVVGVVGRRPKWVLAGAIASSPFCLFVSGYPGIGAVGVVVVALNFLSAWVSRSGWPVVAAVLLVPFLGLTALIAGAVLRQ
jgi:hypothetical protein